MRVDLVALVTLLKLPLNVVGLRDSGLFSGGGLLLDTDLNAVVLLVPLFERSGINLHNGVLHQSLGTHKLVVGGVVDDIQHTDLAGHRLGTPREVTVVQAEGTELGVATTDANATDAYVGRELGHSRLAAELIPVTNRKI